MEANNGLAVIRGNSAAADSFRRLNPTPPTSAPRDRSRHGAGTPESTRSRTIIRTVSATTLTASPASGEDPSLTGQADPLGDPAGSGTDHTSQHGGERDSHAKRGEHTEVSELAGDQVAPGSLKAEDRADPVTDSPHPPQASQHQGEEGDDSGDRQGRSARSLHRDDSGGVLRILDEARQVVVELVTD